jgi:guanine deaminase
MDVSSRPSYTESSARNSLASATEFIASMRQLVSSLPEERKLVHPVLTPRFVPTCSDELLDGLGKLAKAEGVVVQSHMCESVDQMEWVRSTRGKEDEEVFDHVGISLKLFFRWI